MNCPPSLLPVHVNLKTGVSPACSLSETAMTAVQEVWHFAAATHVVVEAGHLSSYMAGVANAWGTGGTEASTTVGPSGLARPQ